jgi:hypothetical protein
MNNPHASNTSPRGIQPFYSTGVRPQPSAIGRAAASGIRHPFFALRFALVGAIIFLATSTQQIRAQLFSQTFGSSSTVSDYVNLTTPSNGQFNAISSSGAGTVLSITSGKLRFARTGNAGAFSRTTDFSGPPTSLIYKFDVQISANSVAQTTAAVFQVGSGFGTANSVQANADVHSRIGINTTATAGRFTFRDLGASSNSGNLDGSQSITWVINNSGGTLTYKAPDGTYETVANDKYDLWAGTTRLFNDANAETSAQSLADLKFAFSNGSATIDIDNIVIDPIPSAPSAAPTFSSVGSSGFTVGWNAATGATGYRLDIATDSGFTSLVSGYDNLAVAGTSQAVSGLNGSTTYYARVRTENNAGTSNHSSTGTQATSAAATAPTGVTTGTAGSITASGATISTSNVTADGGSAITERGVVYNTAASPTTSNTKVTAAGTTGNFNSTLTGLAASTTYYVRAYATNSVGTTYGSDVSFTTSAAAGPNLSAATLGSALTATYPSASSGVSFTAAGTNLTENILVTAQSGYEVSTSSGSGYGASVSVATGTTVWVRFAASRAAGNYNSATAAVLSSAGASNANVTTSSSGNTISKGTPTVSVAPTASAITYGQTLASSNLSGGTASVGGTFAFTTSATAPNAGTASQGVTFTPTDTANYNNATTNVNVTVDKATPVLTITSAANAVIGGTVSLTSTSPAASGSVSASTGAITYTSSNTSVATISTSTLTAVSSGTTTITASQVADSNYNATTATQEFTVTADPVVIFTEGLNNAVTFVTLGGSGGSYYSGNSSTTTWPQNNDLFSEGTHSYGRSGTSGNVTITSNAIDTTNGTSMSLQFRLASFSGTSSNGAEDSDTVVLATSTDNGTTWSNEIQVQGNSNARWSFSSGTGNATTAYDGNATATVFGPSAGGNRTTDGFSTVHLSGLPQASQFRFRITALNNSADERWLIDEIIFRGVLPTVSVNTTSLTAFTATAGTASANQTFTVNGTNLVADIAVGPLTGFEFSTDGTTYSSSLSLARSGDAVANTTIHVRLAANAQLGTYNSQTISIASTGAIAKTVTTAASGNAMSANPADLTAFATAVTQNFNSLASSGTSSSMPASWYFLEAGSSGEVDGVYAANTGSSSTGNTYSMGATSDSDRAIGSIRTSTFNSTYGVALRNTSGSTITTLVVSYTGETWRVGSASRSDTIDFAYSTDATTLASGSWTDVNQLDYANPGQATGSGSLQHSSAIAHTITGLSIPNNATFFLRWTDFDASGSDDMMGIDDVSITALGNPATTLNAAESNATSADFTTTYGTSSANQSFTIGGSNLQGNITATAGTGFEVSSDGTTYGSTATFTRNATYAASGTLYARLTASASAGGTYTSATVATLTSTNAATRTISTDSAGSSVAKATPTINSAPTASAITFGQTLANSDLSGGSATVAGSFVFTTPSTAPAAGTASQGVTFNPTESTNYNSAATSVSVTVNQATPTVSVAPTASAITYGQALSSSTITPGTSSVPGAYAFVSPATTPNAGTASQSISFTPTDTGNYTTASTSASVTVNQAALTITGLAIANKTYDGSDAATITGTAAYSGLVLGQSFGVTGTGSATFANSTVGSSKPVTVTGYTAPNGNYSITQPTGLTGNITAASVTVTAGNQTKAFGASDPALTYTPSPALIVGNSFTGALSRASGEGVGTYAISQGTLSAGSNYTISFIGANLTITQATPTITTPPTASTITSGQALSDSILSGGAASVAGAFAFTTPGTIPSPGIDSQGVTFTPTDSGNYTAPTTSVDVGVLRVAPVLSRASNPTGTGFTVNWAASPGSGNYTVIHSASKNMSSATSVDTGSTSLALTVSTGIRYVQVRANNAAGASANSTMQANNLQSLPVGATRYLSVPGTVNGGNATLAEKFGSANEAGLAAGGTPSTSTNIILLNDDGSSQTGVYFLSGNWVRGASIVNDEVVPAGKAFMLKNNSGSADHILLGGTPTTGPRNPIALSASGGAYSLLTPARSQATALNALGLTGGNATNSLHPSPGSQAADLVLIPQPDGTFRRYHYDGTKWKSGLRDVADPAIVTVPAGGAFFIRKASDSSFEEWTPPAEE